MSYNSKNDGRGYAAAPTPKVNISEIALSDTPNPKLFSEIADRVAQILSQAREKENKPAQLRRFYDELVMWNDKVRTGAAEDRQARYAECAPYIQMLCAKAAYAKGRELVDDNFYGMFKHLIGQIDGVSKLNQAKLFFEAVIGYLKVYKKN